MAGPWFTVLEDGAEWTELDAIRISDGRDEVRVRVEIRVLLEEEAE